MRRLTPILGAWLAMTLAATACAGDDADIASYVGDASMTTEAPATTMAAATAMPGAPPGPSAPPEEAGEPEATGGEVNAATTAAATPADLGRMIVYTATIEVEVDDVVIAGAEAQAAVAGLGGVLFGQETVTGDHPRSILTIKVPPENFHAALERLGGVGKLLTQSVYADDVTERVVDLQSQIVTAEASVERLRAFLEAATDLKTVARFEAELLNRETELEVLRGRLRTLEDQVALATIVLVLTEPVPPVPRPALEMVQTGYAGHDGGAGCPGSEELRIDEDSAYTLCLVVTNTGDTLLADIEVRDPGLRLDEDDFTLVTGTLDAPLPPEGVLVFSYEGEGDPKRFRTDPAVRASAVDDAGDPIRIETETSREKLNLRVDADDSLPGFTDGLGVAWKAMQRIFGIVVVVSGALIPFLWVPVLVIAAVWWWRRREAAKRAATAGWPPAPPEQTTSAGEAPAEAPGAADETDESGA